jgi:hypothetical protein
MLPLPSNVTATVTIERHIYSPLLPQQSSNTAVKHQQPPSSIVTIKR